MGHDAWTTRGSGAQHQDTYLRAEDRTVIERFLHDLPEEDASPADHEIRLEHIHQRDPDSQLSGTGYWRSYYLHRRAELTDNRIREAEVQWDSRTGRPEVALVFDDQGARQFERLSADNIGRRLAILLDGLINSAPTIETRIDRRARAHQPRRHDEPFQLRQQAVDLVAVLRVGSLPVPLVLETEGPLGTGNRGRSRRPRPRGTGSRAPHRHPRPHPPVRRSANGRRRAASCARACPCRTASA